MTLLQALRDALQRIVTARDLMEEGDNRTAEAVLFDLEIDLAGFLERYDERRAA